MLFTVYSLVSAATVTETIRTIKTYPFSDPDPTPIFTRSDILGGSSRIYPNCFFDGFTDKAVEKDWKVVTLDNDFIEITMLPEIGGKIWGATEKTTNNDFIYTNHALKFREISLRGPWLSGGIEWNFGIIGHAPTSSRPVDYLTRQNDDGSVSCIVGTMDMPSRTRWTVITTLYSDKAFIETKTFWYNPTDLGQANYCWMNNAVVVADDMQLILPGRSFIKHDFDEAQKPWPINEDGVDISWYRNNDFGFHKSYFAVGEYENHFGGYWHDRQFGFGHWARYDDMPGQKFWLWAQSREGAMWADLLTDTDGQYIEPQAGRLFNQNDHEFLSPTSAEHWRELWFPYKKTGPMVEASEYCTLNVEKKDGKLKVAICALQQLDGRVFVKADGKPLYDGKLAMKPMDVRVEVMGLEDSDAVITVSIADKLYYTSDPKANDVKRPINFQEYDESTTEGLFMAADRLHKARKYVQALEKYLACLKDEPLHVRALARVAGIYCNRGEYEKGLGFASKALKQSMYDPEANYIYGVISRRQGNMLDARETFGWAARSMQYRSAAYCQMAEMFFKQADLKSAIEYADRSLDYNRYNINAYQVKAIVYRKLERKGQARKVLDTIVKSEPLNHFVRFEKYLLDPTPKMLEEFKSLIRNEFVSETYLELAVYYADLGLNDEAVSLLKEVSDYPTASYWLAYILRDGNPAQSTKHLSMARTLSAMNRFPFRIESVNVFKWAVAQGQTDWKANYYLGLIYWSKGRLDDARKQFDKCGNTDFFPLHLSRAHINKKTAPLKAADDYLYAIKLAPDNWRTYHAAIKFFDEQGKYEEALTLATKAISRFSDKAVIRFDLAVALSKTNQHDKALDILDDTDVLPFEGASQVHGLFVDCHINLACKDMIKSDFDDALVHLNVSMAYPEHLGTGKPYDPDYRKQHYLAALCYGRNAQNQKAEQMIKSIYDYSVERLDSENDNNYFGRIVLEQLGEDQKAPRLKYAQQPSAEILKAIDATK